MNPSSNQNETFSAYSLIMSASFDVNWMTSSLIIYAQLKFKIENCKFLSKFVLISIFRLFEAANICFLLISVKFAAVLRKIKFLKNPRWRPIWRTCYETTVAIATVLN